MASSVDTTCPACGGPAHWNADDGITYCDTHPCPKSKGGPGSNMYVENPEYRPPNRRGGV